MRLTVSLLVLVAACYAQPSTADDENDEKTAKRELLEGNFGLRTHPTFFQRTLHNSNSEGLTDGRNELTQKIVPHKEYGPPKISDVLSGTGGSSFPSVITSHLYSPISAYQPMLGSPTTFELSNPVASQLAYSEHNVYDGNQNIINPFNIQQNGDTSNQGQQQQQNDQKLAPPQHQQPILPILNQFLPRPDTPKDAPRPNFSEKILQQIFPTSGLLPQDFYQQINQLTTIDENVEEAQNNQNQYIDQSALERQKIEKNNIDNIIKNLEIESKTESNVRQSAFQNQNNHSQPQAPVHPEPTIKPESAQTVKVPQPAALHAQTGENNKQEQSQQQNIDQSPYLQSEFQSSVVQIHPSLQQPGIQLPHPLLYEHPHAGINSQYTFVNPHVQVDPFYQSHQGGLLSHSHIHAHAPPQVDHRAHLLELQRHFELQKQLEANRQNQLKIQAQIAQQQPQFHYHIDPQQHKYKNSKKNKQPEEIPIPVEAPRLIYLEHNQPHYDGRGQSLLEPQQQHYDAQQQVYDEQPQLEFLQQAHLNSQPRLHPKQHAKPKKTKLKHKNIEHRARDHEAGALYKVSELQSPYSNGQELVFQHPNIPANLYHNQPSYSPQYFANYPQDVFGGLN